jgi:hypothetical protein
MQLQRNAPAKCFARHWRGKKHLRRESQRRQLLTQGMEKTHKPSSTAEYSREPPIKSALRIENPDFGLLQNPRQFLFVQRLGSLL